MKELVLKKRSELEEICRKTHMVPEVDSTMEYAMEAIESGICLGDCHVTLILHILWDSWTCVSSVLMQELWTLLLSLSKLSFGLERLKRKLLAGKIYLKKWRNGCLHVMRRVGLKSIIGSAIFIISLFKISFFLFTSLCLIVMFWWFRMRTDTMLAEVLILLSSALRKPVLWLINFQVYTWSCWLAAWIMYRILLTLQTWQDEAESWVHIYVGIDKHTV